MLAAVGSRLRALGTELDVSCTFDEPRLVAEELLVGFWWQREPTRYRVRLSLHLIPQGPSTGEVCESSAHWATEVGWVLMEELETGLVARAPRTLAPDGLVDLLWRAGPAGH